MQISIVHIMTISGCKFYCKCGIVGGKNRMGDNKWNELAPSF